MIRIPFTVHGPSACGQCAPGRAAYFIKHPSKPTIGRRMVRVGDRGIFRQWLCMDAAGFWAVADTPQESYRLYLIVRGTP